MSDPPFLREAADRWSLGILRPDDLPALAIDALDRGFDSPNLRMLAGWMPGWLLERDALFLDALSELGVESESRERAIARLAMPILADAAADRVTMAELADALVRTFGPAVLDREHLLRLLYVRATDALYAGDEGDPQLATLYAELARGEAAKILRSLTA